MVAQLKSCSASAASVVVESASPVLVQVEPQEAGPGFDFPEA